LSVARIDTHTASAEKKALPSNDSRAFARTSNRNGYGRPCAVLASPDDEPLDDDPLDALPALPLPDELELPEPYDPRLAVVEASPLRV
jgi:hypothetical protein